jgi:hypothetical protein
MQFELGNYGIQILLGFAVGFGAIAQLIVGKVTTRWLWLIGAAGWLVGGLFMSEVLFGKATVDEIQPIIDGLAYDEALLGGLVGGLLFVVITWLVARSMTGRQPIVAGPLTR